MPIHIIYCGHSFSILSTKICYLSELALVSKLGYQSFMCDAGNIVAAVGTSIPHNYSAYTVQSTQVCVYSCVLCEWSWEISCSLGSWCIACNSISFSVHLLCRPSHLSIQYRSYYVWSGNLLGGTFDNSIRIGHIYANCLARQSLLFTTFLNSLVPPRHHSICCPKSSPSHRMAFLL